VEHEEAPDPCSARAGGGAQRSGGEAISAGAQRGGGVALPGSRSSQALLTALLCYEQSFCFGL